jgi:hypothetical protein
LGTEAVEAVAAVVADTVAETIEAVEAMEAVTTIKAMEPIEAMEEFEAMEASKAIEAIEAVEAMEAMEAVAAVVATILKAFTASPRSARLNYAKAELGGLASDSNGQHPRAKSGLPRRPFLQSPRARRKRSMDADRHTESSRHRGNCDSLRPWGVYCSCSNPTQSNPTLGELETVWPAVPCSSSKSVKAERSWEQVR